AASRKWMRPHIVAGNIEDDAAYRFVAAGGDDPPLRRLVASGLHTCVEARSHDNALRAQHDRRSQAAPVSGTAGRQNWNLVADRVHDRRHQREGALRHAVATGLAALGHDDVGTLCYGIDGLADVMNLTDEQRAGVFHTSHKGLGFAERKPYRTRFRGQGPIEKKCLPRQAPSDEADPEGQPPRVLLPEMRQLAREPRSVTLARADEAAAARLRHCARKS